MGSVLLPSFLITVIGIVLAIDHISAMPRFFLVPAQHAFDFSDPDKSPAEFNTRTVLLILFDLLTEFLVIVGLVVLFISGSFVYKLSKEEVQDKFPRRNNSVEKDVEAGTGTNFQPRGGQSANRKPIRKVLLRIRVSKKDGVIVVRSFPTNQMAGKKFATRVKPIIIPIIVNASDDEKMRVGDAVLHM